jgi:hypothetical protein
LADLASASAVSRPLLHLDPTGSPDDLLDGAWWPRSADASVELPELVLAIDNVHGEVVSVRLGAEGWRHRSTHLSIGGRRVGVGYFASQPASLLTASCEHGARINLLVVTPLSSEVDAGTAMSHAITIGNRVTAAHRIATRQRESYADGMWAVDRGESEGGHL